MIILLKLFLTSLLLLFVCTASFSSFYGPYNKMPWRFQRVLILECWLTAGIAVYFSLYLIWS